MTASRLLVLAAATLALAACDDAVDLVEQAAKKGETDVPAEARAPLDDATVEALRQRAQGQNFN